jgi:hypothetical protein
VTYNEDLHRYYQVKYWHTGTAYLINRSDNLVIKSQYLINRSDNLVIGQHGQDLVTGLRHLVKDNGMINEKIINFYPNL